MVNVEHLLEALIEIHSTSPTFREVFRSNAITQSFIDAYKMYSTSIAYSLEIDQSTVRVLEKLSHLGLSIALDNSVAVGQKQEVNVSIVSPYVQLYSNSHTDNGRSSICREPAQSTDDSGDQCRCRGRYG